MRRLWALALVATMVTATAASAGMHQYRGFDVVNVQVNGVPLTTDVPAINFYGRTMLPVRAVVEAMNGQVTYDAAANTVLIERPEAAQAVPGDTQALQQENESLRQERYALWLETQALQKGSAAVQQENQALRDQVLVTESERDDLRRRVAQLEQAVSDKTPFVDVQLVGSVDPYQGIIHLKELGLATADIEALWLTHQGRHLPRILTLQGDQLAISGEYSLAGGTALDFYQSYLLTIFTNKGIRYRVSFRTAGLPDISNVRERTVIFVPAMPEKGFHWPYFLVLPSERYKTINQQHKRYLMVESNNTQTTDNLTDDIAKTRRQVAGPGTLSARLTEELWVPFLSPVFPRPHVRYQYSGYHNGESNTFLTHSLDRDTARLHLMLQDPHFARVLEQRFTEAGLDVRLLKNLDLQLIAMIDHAIAYLNEHGYGMEKQRVFLSGYSASGTFTDRFATLHPDRVKAVASGATMDDLMLPLAEHRGEQLIFPIGTSDYREITGRNFDLARHNQIARLIYMGKDDQSDTLPFGDCYGDTERGIITRLWGTDLLARAEQLRELYGTSGGKGMFILDVGIGHGYSTAMSQYVKTFFAANRDGEAPVYPTPDDPSQLEFVVFK